MHSWRAIFFSAFLIIAPLLPAQTTLSAKWIQQYGDIDEEYAFGIAVDDSSNTFVTGLIGPDDTSFYQRSQCVNHDIFVARYDNQGNAKWLTKLGGLGTDIGWGITVDKLRNIYAVGTFQDVLHLGNDSVQNNGFFDAILLKYDAQGTLHWARHAGGVLDDEAFAVATDSRNNIYVAGSFQSTAKFDTLTLMSRGYGDVFLAKYDTSGNLRWAINAGGGKGEDAAYSLAIDRWDNLYLTGKFSDTAFFYSDTLFAAGSSDVFTARFDTTGAMQWIRQGGGPGTDIGQGIRASINGSVYVTGYFSQNAIFGGASLVAQGGSDVFIARYDSQGALNWLKGGGGSTNDEGAAVAIGKDQNIYVSGYFGDTAAFGNQLFYSSGAFDAYLACVDSMGNFIWTKQGGGPGMDAAGSVCADTAGAIYLAGIFDYSCAFDTITVTSVNNQNFFVAKFQATQVMGVQNNAAASAELSVFPNPSSSSIFLMFNKNLTSSLHIELMNELGQILLKKEFPPGPGEKKINLEGLSKGTYVLQIYAQGEAVRRKIVIE